MGNSRFRNECGYTVILALAGVALVGMFSGVVATVASSKAQQSKQANIGHVADSIRQNLVNLVTSPWSWEKTVVAMPGVFANGNHAAIGKLPESQRKLELYNVDATGSYALYYNASSNGAGFTPQGLPCNPNEDGEFVDSKTGGNPKCPFHYDVTIQSRIVRSGESIDVVRFQLKFRPGPNSNWIFNDTDLRYNFDLTRNFDGKSVETTCFMLDGVYVKDAARCSKRITQDTACGIGQAYAGAIQYGPVCPSLALNTACSSGSVMTGFTTAGDPKCSSLQ